VKEDGEVSITQGGIEKNVQRTHIVHIGGRKSTKHIETSVADFHVRSADTKPAQSTFLGTCVADRRIWCSVSIPSAPPQCDSHVISRV
jgi:hypothetical protein